MPLLDDFKAFIQSKGGKVVYDDWMREYNRPKPAFSNLLKELFPERTFHASIRRHPGWGIRIFSTPSTEKQQPFSTSGSADKAPCLTAKERHLRKFNVDPWFALRAVDVDFYFCQCE
jgi:hypothetical protein